MQNKAAISLLHAKWHRRVEGQIRGCFNEHPEYIDLNKKNIIINSLAKRIVGEIIAESRLANNSEESGCTLQSSGKSDVDKLVSDNGRDVGIMLRLFKRLRRVRC